MRQTVTSAGRAAVSHQSVIGFRGDGTVSTRFANNRGVALFTLWGDRRVVPAKASVSLSSPGPALSLAQSTDLW